MPCCVVSCCRAARRYNGAVHYLEAQNTTVLCLYLRVALHCCTTTLRSHQPRASLFRRVPPRPFAHGHLLSSATADLVVDTYLEEVVRGLEERGLTDDAEEVEIHQDGHWDAILEDQKVGDEKRAACVPGADMCGEFVLGRSDRVAAVGGCCNTLVLLTSRFGSCSDEVSCSTSCFSTIFYRGVLVYFWLKS